MQGSAREDQQHFEERRGQPDSLDEDDKERQPDCDELGLVSGDCENVRIGATAVSGGAGASLEPCTLAPRRAGEKPRARVQREQRRSG